MVATWDESLGSGTWPHTWHFRNVPMGDARQHPRMVDICETSTSPFRPIYLQSTGGVAQDGDTDAVANSRKPVRTHGHALGNIENGLIWSSAGVRSVLVLLKPQNMSENGPVENMRAYGVSLGLQK
ncbi:hypothetical protein OIDMADRAFT_49262 [Oidiodendron maius Zn]|uniref:Uncharacterized protein n=1 Tax=Oidiodendron maius (strain Zn) TaxID=913774 RepID=A0A0C3HRV2_OIDMZ|nr:hypothetical protein OIDMADRAFT_49262 [Oidiodendron maius Zn]